MASGETGSEGGDALSALQQVRAARAQGMHRFAPVRFRLIEAMSRRAEPYEGEARHRLDARVIELLAAYRAAFGHAQPPAARSAAEDAAPHRGPDAGPIAGLVALLAQHAAMAPDGEAAPADPQAHPSTLPALPAVPHPLKTMRYFSGTWSRLSADRRLRQSLAKLPENAGPLNSHQLVHRALTLMHDVSPAYLNRFMAYVDTLSYVEQLAASSAPAGSAPRAEGSRKTSGRGGRSG